PAASQQFSAEMVSTGTQGGGHSSKIYVSGSKLRIDQGAHEGFMLTDSKAGTTYVVIPQQRMYMEMGAMGGGRMMHVFIPDNPNDACPEWLNLSKSAGHEGAGSAVATCRRVGSDTVGGRSAIK